MALSDQEFARLSAKLAQNKISSGETYKQTDKGFIKGVKESFAKRTDTLAEGYASGQNIGSSALQSAGQTAGLIGDVAFEGVKAITPDFISKPIGKAVEAIGEVKPVQDVAMKVADWAKQNPEAARNLQAVVDIGSLIPIGKGAQVAGKAGVKAGEKALEVAGKGISSGIKTTGDIIEPVTRIASRVSTNMAEGQAKRAAINELPIPSFRNAAKEGIEITDLKSLTQIPKTERAPLKKLFENVRDFSSGKSKVNPFETVGKPIVSRLKTINNQVKGYATQLDGIAKKLEGQAVKGYTNIRNSVSTGLDDLKITVGENGKLDFTGSNLEGLGKSGNIVENVANRIYSAKDAAEFHRLKKFIDENVSYGKRVEGLSGEAEKLLKSWRKSIDQALDAEFPAYNKVNTELSKRIQPLNDLKDLLKNADGLDTDLLAQKAGVIARRITSAAPSGPEIKQILRNLDKFTQTKGKTLLSTERLQDFYNILNKYYEIAPKTGFQNLVKEGTESVSSISGFAIDKARKLAGQTNAVRQKALEKALNDLFGN